MNPDSKFSSPAQASHRRLIWLLVLIALPLAGSLYSSSEACHMDAHANIPLHAMLESQGGLVCLALAALMLFLGAPKADLGRNANLIIASGLIFGGVLDGFHAAHPPGNPFVWLRTLSTCGGGLIMALLLWPARMHSRLLPAVALAAALLCGTHAFFAPDNLPLMIRQGEFTRTAMMMNTIGGLGYLVGTVCLFRN
ncbi:MAG TPA: hypothetical protein VF258_03945, partial [Luteolibacter sp.]